MNTKNLMKKITMGVFATTLSITANAGFMTIGGSGAFFEAKEVDGDLIAITNTTNTSSISWGTPDNTDPSKLLLKDELAQSIDFLDTNYLLSTLTHFNNPISGGWTNWLTSAVIKGVLNISGDFQNTGSDVTPPPIPTLFDIKFEETNNLTTSHPTSACQTGDNGETGPTDTTQHLHGTVCDDKFDYTVDGGSFPFFIPLTIAGVDYHLNIFAARDAAGTDLVTANRFWTEEESTTSIYTFANLSKVTVPEPASIAILGLGLLGLAASRKRQS